MHLSNLQNSQIPAFWHDDQYPDSFNTGPLPHRHFNHALTHAMKALGKLAGYSDSLDHGQMDKPGARSPEQVDPAERAKWLADLVICAGRLAQQDGINLDAAVEERLVALGQRWGAEMPSTQPTIAELETLLQGREDVMVTAVLPNGEVTAVRGE